MVWFLNIQALANVDHELVMMMKEEEEEKKEKSFSPILSRKEHAVCTQERRELICVFHDSVF